MAGEPAGTRLSSGHDADGLRIVMPARREAFVVVFAALALFVWTSGGYYVGVALANGAIVGAVIAHTAIWFCMLAFGIAFAVATLGWALLGREEVTLAHDAVTLKRRAGFYSRTQRFPRAGIQDVRTEPYRGVLSRMLRPRISWTFIKETWGLGGGSLFLHYEDGTYQRFGRKLDEVESQQVAALLRRELGLPARAVG